MEESTLPTHSIETRRHRQENLVEGNIVRSCSLSLNTCVVQCLYTEMVRASQDSRVGSEEEQ